MVDLDVQIDDFDFDERAGIWRVFGTVYRAGFSIRWTAEAHGLNQTDILEPILEPPDDPSAWLIVAEDQPAYIRRCINDTLRQHLWRMKKWRQSMSILTHGGLPISRWSDWPHEDDKWKAGRSAMELAKHWTGAQVVPADVDELLTAEFGPVHLVQGQPEKATSLPPLGSRGPRMHDLWLKGSVADKQKITICVEAKADESFGETVAEYETAAAAALRKSPNSKRQARLGILKNMIWGQSTPVNVTSLRYQLLSALTGTAIQTLVDKTDIGVLLIHVFDTDQTTAVNRYKNDIDLTDFLSTVTVKPSTSTTRKGHFLGRVTVVVPADFSPNGKATPVEVYFAKLTTTT